MNAAIINLLEHCQRSAWRQRIVLAAASGTPVNLTTVDVSAVIRVDTLARATSTAHGFVVGDEVTISGATGETAFNGTFNIVSVPDANTFTYTVPNTIVTVAAGTIVAKAALWYRRARIIGLKAARTANVGIVYLGLAATNDSQPVSIAASAILEIEAAVGARLDLGDLWLDVATNADGVVIWWH